MRSQCGPWGVMAALSFCGLIPCELPPLSSFEWSGNPPPAYRTPGSMEDSAPSTPVRLSVDAQLRSYTQYAQEWNARQLARQFEARQRGQDTQQATQGVQNPLSSHGENPSGQSEMCTSQKRGRDQPDTPGSEELRRQRFVESQMQLQATERANCAFQRHGRGY